MKAAQIVGLRKIEIVEVEEPSLGDAPSMIKVHIQRATLCGSDIPWFDHDHNGGYPLPPGESIHECLGTVVESTSALFAVGDLVIAVPARQAGLCEYFCTSEDKAIHLPRNGMPLDQLLMAQPLGTVIWACSKLGNVLDLHTVVVGQGPIGLLFSHLLSNMGAKTVTAMDVLDYRLSVADEMRATHTVNVEREDAIAAVHEITGGKMADVVVEAVGHQPETIGLCIELTRRLGTVIAFGVPDGAIHPSFPYGQLFRKNTTLIGSVGADVVPNYSLARDMIVQGRLDVSPLITHIMPFTAIQRAYELFVDREDGAVKVVLDYEQ